MESQTSTSKTLASSNGSDTTEPATPKRKLNKRFLIIFSILIIGGAAFGIVKYNHAQHHEETDDAQIEASISPVIPRTAGYIAEIKVNDNQRVKKGDTLLVLDNRDLVIRLEQAEAALAGAQSNLSVAQATTSASQANTSSSRANIGTVSAQIEAARINVRRTTQDFNRYANLIKDHSITQQQYEQAEAAKQTAERQLGVLEQQRAAATQQTAAASSQSNATAQGISVAEATIRQRRADVENAKLNLSYTILTAPSDGFISKVAVQPGQYIQAGQTLFAVVRNADIWVVANFKETQINRMHEGQEVIVHADAFPGHDFKAKLASFSPATGARFSLLPPDNASGNFVKVVQRVPVRIEFADPNDPAIKALRAGMNVYVDVHI
jgi:membrane fusion protein (multidrug efflux system)